MGSTNCAVQASSVNSDTYQTWKGFDNNISTLWVGAANTIPVYVTFYNQLGLKITNVKIIQNNTSLYATSGSIKSSNDNNTFINIGTFSGATSGTFNIPCNNSGYYKYNRYYIATGVGGRCDTQEILFTATVKIS